MDAALPASWSGDACWCWLFLTGMKEVSSRHFVLGFTLLQFSLNACMLSFGEDLAGLVGLHIGEDEQMLWGGITCEQTGLRPGFALDILGLDI